jgi:protein-S-isoprenylcysteine O-methyltransferase Ste14
MRDADAPVRTDKPVPRLTTDGPFRYTRNPGYLSLAMIYAGIAVLRNALWAILLLPLVLFVIQREVIGREEHYLERTFGEEFPRTSPLGISVNRDNGAAPATSSVGKST